MKLFAATATVAALANVQAEDATATPVEKVMQLMQSMLDKGDAAVKAEEVEFAKTKMFCENTVAEKTKAIEKANEDIEELKADIEKYAADAAKLKAEIAAHDEDLEVWKGDVKATTKVREIEKNDFDATHKDYSESVSALERAISTLKAKEGDTKQASFLQLSSLKSGARLPAEAKQAIEAFMQEDSAGQSDAPEANAYESASGGIIDMLEKLLDKFIAERTLLEKEESDSKHAFEMMMQDLKTQIGHAQTDRESKSDTESKKKQGKANAEGDLEDVTGTRDADSKYLGDLVAECETKAADYVSRQKLRADEKEAITKAMEIIGGGDVAGNADKHLPGLLQMRESLFGAQQGVALAQLRSDQVALNANKAMAQAFLEARASTTGSRILSAIALRVAADPFGKVKKMIKDLIVRLMEEAAEETEHKGWCDTELGTNENVRREKTEAVETLHAEIDQLDASITKLTEDIAGLSKAVADLDAAMAEATKIREEEKTENAATVEDAKAAQTAVAQALTVLKEFYAKAAEATAFVQGEASYTAPEQGMQGEAGGVMGMLEVIQSDFARLESDTKSSEATAQKEFETFMTDSKVDHMGKSKDIEHKTSKKEDQESTLAEKKADLEGTQKELDAALDYFDKLKPSCIESGVSFEDRVARRKEEIESLQQALRILNGEDIS
jgi:prefoldin subunit 5